MINELKADVETRMKKAVEAFRRELERLRTGRAQPSLLEPIMVSYYGSDTPLNQVASISTLDARTLQVAPWEKNLIPTIEKAIMQAGLGLNPSTSGDVIRIPLPSLTEERRKDLIKIVKNEAEKSKVAVRNIRRDANEILKKAVKNKEMSEDDEHRGEEEVQKLTDHYIKEMDGISAQKEKDLLEV
ncbi:MAG: ribosome recycling factor [Gammaproteobacteria bacterium]|nr:ribosome recycling factor [Gammaproteobacteria bacterium]MCP4474336.1 ribosome recycling factor [Gammaproteobacteria bacterium]